ncbi:MAG TPA: plastocyanin/azurin family copper-binding protein [Bryobacteraceae bacterium]|nr:plastocyanin/azurin family copper-binding protein [Bryobacteraceae bacterium]
MLQYQPRRIASFAVAALLAGIAAGAASATQWEAQVGAQNASLTNQALAFLPNEFWIHAGDSIRFTFLTDEMHTVTFLKPAQVRPALNSPTGVFVGCPGTTPDGSSFDNSTCVTSGPAITGQTFSVTFPSANNFKLVCLVHSRMTGAIHVLPLSDTLPYDQDFYDRQAVTQRAALLSEAIRLADAGSAEARRSSGHEVTAGISSVLANGGGSQTISIMRFLGDTTVVHVGDTVEWTNLSSPPYHTITFGTEPANLMPPSSGMTMDDDGVRQAVMTAPTDSVNSGFMGIPNQETIGQPQAPLDVTRFRVTFTAPGTFSYICGLHDLLGMIGTVIVQ